MIKYIPINLLHNNSGQIEGVKQNPRDLTTDGFDLAIKSIHDFPEMLEVRTLVVTALEDIYIVIGGNQRLRALISLGYKEAPCTLVKWNVDQINEFIIKDNLEYGAWNYDLLANEWEAEQLIEWGMELPVDFNVVDEEPINGLTDEDDIPDPPADPISKYGDVWILNNHRVMCGDSTDIIAVETLLNGNNVDLLFTDPPYNVAFKGRSGKHDIIKNDNLSTAEFKDFIDDILGIIEIINPQVYYIWCNWKFYGLLQNKLKYKACIVWAKNVFGLGNGYRHQHEFCLFNGKLDEVIKNETDLWEIKKDTNYMHPTQKPVALSVRAFGNHIKLLNILDLFGGSGSTLIGATQTGRNAFIMELDPKYCDVIIKRWQNYSGKNAILESTKQSFNELDNGKTTK